MTHLSSSFAASLVASAYAAARRLPAPRAVLLRGVAMMGVAIGIGGCGRPATEAECSLIVDRIIEVELKASGVTEAEATQRKKEELRAASQKELKDCVGRRITAGMLECVKGAATADEINQCIR